MRHLLLLTLALILSAGTVPFDVAGAADPAESTTPVTQHLYATTRGALLKVRTLVTATGQQYAIGSGFMVAGKPFAVTNYHVVSESALQPDAYRLEYQTTDGHSGTATLLAVDVTNDLALIGVDYKTDQALAFDPRVQSGDLPKGEHFYALGNPQDLGFTIVEGTNSGPVDHSYQERLHFTGPLNPGMSGGPTLSEDGRVVGVNVAKQQGSDLVSFLVPGGFALALVNQAVSGPAPSPNSFKDEIGRQLSARQARLVTQATKDGFRPGSYGPYSAPELGSAWANCWSQTNAGQVPRPRAALSSTYCTGDTSLFVAGDLNTGSINVAHSYVRSVDLNSFQFASFLSQQDRLQLGPWSRKWQTQQRCEQNDLAGDPADNRPPLRTLWCARANKVFANLYDVGLMTVTEDRSQEALISRLILRGFAYPDAQAEAKRFMEAIRWRK